jgi:hypothetical protein
MNKMIIGTILATLLTGCSNSNDAHRALEAMGFTDIQTTGYKWFACSDYDFYHTGFVAKNPQGYTVNGVVCSGFFFKNSTVRF